MRQETPPPSLQSAIDQVATHGRALVQNRIDLLTLEGKEAVARAGKRLLETTLAILLGLCGFVALSVGGTVLLAEKIGLPYASLSVGVTYLAIATFLGALGTRSEERHASASSATQAPRRASSKEGDHALH